MGSFRLIEAYLLDQNKFLCLLKKIKLKIFLEYFIKDFDKHSVYNHICEQDIENIHLSITKKLYGQKIDKPI